MLQTVAASALICCLAIYLDLPELVPAIAIPYFAWHIWRVYRISILGSIFGVATLELITGIASLLYHDHGSILALPCFQLLFVSAFGFMLASVIAFLVRAYATCACRRRNVLAAVASCLLPILWFAFGPRNAGILSEWKLQREIAASELPEFINELNRVTERLGRVPKNEQELVELLGKPIPRLSRGQIRYCPSNSRCFTLVFGYDLGCYRFDSRQPENGWRTFLGPAEAYNQQKNDPAQPADK